MILILTLSSSFITILSLVIRSMYIVLITRYRYFFLFLGINFSNQHAYVVIYQLFDYIFDISMCCLFLFNLIYCLLVSITYLD